MNRPRHALTVLIAGLGLFAATVVPAFAGDAPPHSHVVSGSARSALHKQVTFITGDREWLVYSTSDVNGAGVANHSTDRLYARSRAGKVIALGGINRFSYQVTGDTLTAASSTVQVKAWNLAKGTHTTARLPKGAHYLGAASSGILYYNGDRMYLKSTTKGTVTDLGWPFPGFDPATGGDPPLTSIASQKYAVFAATNGQVAAYEFATKTFTDLKVPSSSYEDDIRCTAILNGYVACSSARENDDNALVPAANLLSLSGGAGRFVVGAGIPALGDQGMSWTAKDRRLHTLSYSGKKHTSTVSADNQPPISAFGTTLVTRHGRTTVAKTPGASHPMRPVFTSARSQVEVGAWSLNEGRIAWRDDSGPNGADILQVARVSKGVVSGAHRIAAKLGIPAVGVSATTLVYGAVKKGQSGLQVTSTSHSRFIPGIKDPLVDVSGRRVLYFSGTGPRLVTAKVYDATTGKTRTIASKLLNNVYGVSASIDGNRVAYQRRDASVWVYDLRTHKTTKVRNASSYSFRPQVHVAQNYVAWGFPHEEQYRNVATMAAPTSIDLDNGGLLVGLTDHGVIIEKEFTTTRLSYSLVRFGDTGGPQFVLTTGGVPAINGSTVAWRDSSFALRVADVAGL